MKKKIPPRQPVIILSIETKARELSGKLLLSCFLVEKGFRVIITNYRRISFASETGAWLYIDRNSFAPRMSFFQRLKFFGFKLVCIDEEGIVWRKNEVYKSRIHVKTNGYVDMYLTWGKKQTELIKEVSPVINTVVTGNPRIDLLRPELTSLYKKKSELLKEKYGSFILFVSNFATNNSFYSKFTNKPLIDILVKEMSRHGFLNTPESEEEYRAFFENRTRVFDKVTFLLKNLSKRFPEMNIIIRPHPSENHDTWEEYMKGCPNVRVLYEGELTPWILAAKAVIHNSCTTGIEAALLNIKAIAYIPVEEPEFESELPNSVSASAFTEDEVIALVEKSPLSQTSPSIINDYISSISGAFACEKIAEEVLRLYDERTFIDIIKRNILFGNNWFSKKITKKINKILIRLNKKDKEIITEKASELNEYKKQKLQQITAGECNALLDEYKVLLGRFDSIRADDSKGYLEISNL